MKPPETTPRLDLFTWDGYVGSVVLDDNGVAIPTNEAAAKRMGGIGVGGRRAPGEPRVPLTPADGAFYMFWLDVEHWHCSMIASGFREGPEGHPCPLERHHPLEPASAVYERRARAK